MSSPLNSIPGLHVGGGAGGGGGGGGASALVFNVQAAPFNAVGNGIANDAAAIAAADAAAAAAGGGIVWFPQPSVAYLTLSELTPSPGVQWIGTAVKLGECEIRAGVAMRSVLHVANYTSTLSPTPNRFSGLTINANGLAQQACLSDGDFLTVFERVFFTNAIKNGQRSGNRSVALTLSAVTPGGGAPAGVTISQPDLNFASFTSPGVKSIVLRIVTPGNLNIATYQTSFDGGATFQVATQPIAATSNINLPNGSIYGPPTGIQAQFPAQAYPANGTYSFTATVAADQFGGNSINADRRFYDVYWVNNGTVFASAALAGNYNGNCRLITVSAGTVATTAGSQIVKGAGTSFMSFGAQEGDLCLLNGQLFAITSVLDDLTIAIANTAAPTFTLAGLNYAVGVGSGYHEDGNPENVRGILYAGSAHANASSCFRFGGSQGPVVTQTRTEFYGFAAYAIASTVTGMTGAPLLLHPHVEAGATGSASIYTIGNVCTAIEPPELWTNAGPGHGYKVVGGQQFPWNAGAATSVPIYAQVYVEGSATSLTTGAETLAVPVLETTGQTSVVLLSPTQDVVMTSAPIFPGAAALPNGVMVLMENISANFSVTIQADFETGSGIRTKGRFVTIGANGFMTLMSFNGKLYQFGPEANVYSSASGNPGEVSSRTLVTANATPTVIWEFNVVNTTSSSGTTAIWDVVARSNGVTNLGSWTNYRAMWNVAGGPNGPMAYAPGLAIGSGAGNMPPLGWGLSLGFDGANQFARILATGDNSANPVHWKIYVRHGSPPI